MFKIKSKLTSRGLLWARHFSNNSRELINVTTVESSKFTNYKKQWGENIVQLKIGQKKSIKNK